jgi:hypothetical protein
MGPAEPPFIHGNRDRAHSRTSEMKGRTQNCVAASLSARA